MISLAQEVANKTHPETSATVINQAGVGQQVRFAYKP